MMPQRSGRRRCIALLLGFAGQLAARDAASQTEGGLLEVSELDLESLLNTTVALPAMEKETTRESPSSITVFSERDIRALGVRTLDELLNVAPGVDVRRYREPINIIAVRGVESEFNERVLIMIDGVRLNDVYTGGTARTVRAINLDNVERVEIISGPGSALYGTNAFAAVINVVTRGGGSNEGMRALAAYGRFDTRVATLTLNNVVKRLQIGGYFNYSESGGQSFAIGQDGAGNSSAIRDPYRDFFAGMSIGYGYRLRMNWNFGRRETKDFITVGDVASADARNAGTWLSGSIEYVQPIGERLRITAKPFVGYNRWGTNTIPFPANPTFPNGMYTHPLDGMWHAGLDTHGHATWDRHSLILGLGFETEQLPLASDYRADGMTGAPTPLVPNVDTSKRRYLTAAYAQYRWAITEDLKLTAGARLDHYSDFGNTANPRVGLVYSPVRQMYGKFIVGTAFRAPSFREAYTINNPVTNGNPDVAPEKILCVELVLGIRPHPNWSLQLTAFQNSVDEIILPTVNPATNLSLYQNRGQLTTSGMSGEISGVIQQFLSVRGNYTYIDARNLSGTMMYGTPLIAKHIANLILTADFQRHFQVTPYVQIRGSRGRDPTQLDAGSPDPRGSPRGYVLLNANLRVYDLFHEKLEFFLHATNILNVNYNTPSNYPPKIQGRGIVPDDIQNRGFELLGGVVLRFL